MFTKACKTSRFCLFRGLVPNYVKTISAAQAGISTTSNPRSCGSDMLLALKIALILLLRHFLTLNFSSFKQKKGKNIYRLAQT